MIKKEIIDIAEQHATDIKGRTIYNDMYNQIALRLEEDTNGNVLYICYAIDGTEWEFKNFRQACVFHSIADQISLNYEVLNEYYDAIKNED